MKILLADSYYPEFIKGLPFDPASTYEAQLRKVLSYGFGTADFPSRNLRALGHECMDVIYNHHDLQNLWANENYSGQGRRGEWILDLQIERFKPDVVFLQDLSIKFTKGSFLIAGQCSCPWPGDKQIQRCSVVMTSFPHYVKRIEALGVKAVYLPLAFEPRMLGNTEVTHMYSVEQELIWGGPESESERDIDISFCGGVGRDSHWQYGTDVLEAVAAHFGACFHWYGYGRENLPAASALRGCYRGEAWGRKMYGMYRRSKCVITRHGEVAQGYTNNLRCFEATGMGAALFTEQSANLRELFPADTVIPYTSATHLVSELERFLGDDAARNFIALAGQRHTLAHHTYAKRMRVVSEVLQEMLCTA